MIKVRRPMGGKPWLLTPMPNSASEGDWPICVLFAACGFLIFGAPAKFRSGQPLNLNIGYQLCQVQLSLPAQSVDVSTTDTGYLHPPERHLAIVYHAVTNAVRLTTLEKLLTVVITLVRSGSKSLESFRRARDAVVLGTKFRRGPISDTKPHGQKITSFHYRKVAQMTSPTSSRCATNVSSERTQAPNPAF